MRAGMGCRGITHREACRVRIEAHLREAGNPRITAADARWADRIVAEGDTSVEPRAEEGQEPPPVAGGTGPGRPAPQSSAADGQPAPTQSSAADGQPANQSVSEAGGPASAGDAVQNEAEDDAMSDMGSEADPMLEALLATMTAELAEDARSINNLFIINGCTSRDAQKKVVELYSPPRVTSALQAAPSRYPGLRAGSTFDLHEDEHGEKYDFLKSEDRQRCRERLRAERPWLVVGSPPCTWWSALMALNRAKMSRAEVERRDVEAKTLLYFACEVYRQQLREGRHFLHEHPEAARSWADEQVKGILDNPAVGSVVGHQCMYGQTALTDDGERLPVKKATRWMSSAPEVLARLGHRCRGGHRHQPLLGAVRRPRRFTRRNCARPSSGERRLSAGARAGRCRPL